MTKTYQFASPVALLRTVLLLAFLLAPTVRGAFAQALPAAEASPISTGFELPTGLGSLQYAVSASQSLNWGYYANSGVTSMTNLAGDVAYLSNSKRYPSSLIFSGGHTFGESGESSYNFLNLGFSQVINAGRWNFLVSDNASYLPGTPVSLLSGVPGIGDLGINPGQIGVDTGQGVLSNFSNRVSNTVAGNVQRQLTGKTAINGSGSYTTLRFLDSSINSIGTSSAGLDNGSITGAGGISHQIDARTAYGANYAYTQFKYSGNSFGVLTPNFITQTASAMISHNFTRKLSLNAAAGPQWTTLSSGGGGAYLSVFVDTSANYAAKSLSSSLSFLRSTNSGFGTLSVSVSDSVTFSASRRFSVVWNCSASSAFTRTSTVALGGVAPISINTAVEGIQISRAIARSLSGYAAYTFEDQSSSGGPTFNTFSGISQVVGFGLTYSPTALHIGRR